MELKEENKKLKSRCGYQEEYIKYLLGLSTKNQFRKAAKKYKEATIEKDLKG